MHILPAFYTTTVNGRKKKSKSAPASLSKHEKWLISKGLHPEQIKKKKDVDSGWKKRYTESMMVDRSTRRYDDKELIAGDCSKRDIMTNLHKEPKHVQEAILEKASRVMPLYNKGGLQLLSPNDDLKTVGSKSRRG
jgi:hypothetical protein